MEKATVGAEGRSGLEQVGAGKRQGEITYLKTAALPFALVLQLNSHFFWFSHFFSTSEALYCFQAGSHPESTIHAFVCPKLFRVLHLKTQTK